jgi:hypothetical protein
MQKAYHATPHPQVYFIFVIAIAKFQHHAPWHSVGMVYAIK